MSEHAHLSHEQPVTPSYEDHPIEHARRVVSVMRTGGKVDKGWRIEGEGIDDKGRAYYKVAKIDGEKYLEKLVGKEGTDKLNAELAAEREANRAKTAMAHVATEAVVHIPAELTPTYESDPSEWARPRSEIMAEIKAQEVADKYRLLKDSADKLGSGTFDPSVMRGSIGHEVELIQHELPDESKTLAQVQEILGTMDGNNYTAVGRRISQVIEQRLGS